MGEPSDNLYVTNLPAGLDDSEVMQFFSIYGTVASCKVLKNPLATGRTAALIQFETIEEAASILKTLSGSVPTGLDEPVQIKFAAKRDPSKGAGKVAPPPAALDISGKGYGKSVVGVANPNVASPYGKGGAGNWGEPEISDNIYVQGLPAGTSQESLHETFSEFGNIQSIKLLPPKGPDASCAALIRYDSTETAKLTKEILNGQTPEGFSMPLIVRYANIRGSKGEKAGYSGEKGGAWAQTQYVNGKGNGNYPAPPPPAVEVNGSESLSCISLVDMVYQSDMLPGGKKYYNVGASLYVAGLPWDCTDTHLYKMFAPYGAIHTCNTKAAGADAHNWAIGFVNYLDPLSAEAAITAYNGMSLPDGNQLKVTIKNIRNGGK